MSRFDDPVDAALERIASEERQDDQFLGIANTFGNTAKSIAKALCKLVISPTPHTLGSLPAEVVRGWQSDAAKRTEENQIYVVDAIVDKLNLHDHELLKDTVRLDRLEDTVSHTLAYVSSVTSRDRLDSLAAIAVSGAMVFVTDPIEQTEEFLRIAISLQNTDVMVLREIKEIQGTETQGFHGSSQFLHQVQVSWKPVLLKLEQCGIQPLNYRSAFVRLQAAGLLERTEPAPYENGLGETPYQMLELGERFLEYLEDHHRQKI
jgi:hypothetical protein